MNNSFNDGRRRFVLGAMTASAAAALTKVSPLWAAPAGRHFKDQVLTDDIKNLTISEANLAIGSKTGLPITINGQMPGPLIRLKEGQRAQLNVTNRLEQDTSIHWHGIILPAGMVLKACHQMMGGVLRIVLSAMAIIVQRTVHLESGYAFLAGLFPGHIILQYPRLRDTGYT